MVISVGDVLVTFTVLGGIEGTIMLCGETLIINSLTKHSKQYCATQFRKTAYVNWFIK